MKFKRPRFIAPSTLAWLREARKMKGYSFFDLLHGYIYGRWPFFYIRLGTGQHPLTRLIAPIASRVIAALARPKASPTAPEPSLMETFANTYHGKVVPLESARQLVVIKEEIQAAVPETILPYDRARDIILKNPDHIVALDCPCRVARDNPCLPLDVCLIIGEPFASFISEHQPARTRWINAAEAEEILQAEDKRGHVHHAFFKDAMLGRFYAICNCCSCCCGAMHAHRNGTPMLASSGFVAQIDAERCSGCGICVKQCSFQAIILQPLPGSQRSQAVLDPALCMGCGICANQCARKAISLQRDPARGEPLEIIKLLENAPL
jgi:ferredoxin